MLSALIIGHTPITPRYARTVVDLPEWIRLVVAFGDNIEDADSTIEAHLQYGLVYVFFALLMLFGMKSYHDTADYIVVRSLGGRCIEAQQSDHVVSYCGDKASDLTVGSRVRLDSRGEIAEANPMQLLAGLSGLVALPIYVQSRLRQIRREEARAQ